MTSTHGIIEIESPHSKNEIFGILKEVEGIESVQEEGDRIFLKLNMDISAADLNKQLMKRGIELSHLVKRRPTLEQQFLTLTNNK